MMRKRSVLAKQSVERRKKKKDGPSLFDSFRRIAPALLKGVLLVFIFACISMSLLYGHYYLHASSLLKLEKIEIVGVDDRIKRELIEMGDFKSDSNLLFIDLKDLKHRMEAHPWIRSVELKRKFLHTLVVKAEKHRPIAVIIKDRMYYMDQQCDVFKEVGAADDVDFPVITGISEEDLKSRDQLVQASRIMDVLTTQQRPWSLNELSEIHFANHKVSLYFRRFPAKIHVIDDNLPEKMACLRRLTNHLRKTGQIQLVTGIDLNSVDGAVVSFRRG